MCGTYEYGNEQLHLWHSDAVDALNAGSKLVVGPTKGSLQAYIFSSNIWEDLYP